MATISHILGLTDRIPDAEMQAICRRLIEEVAERAKRKNLGFWTVDVISKWVGRPPADPVVLDCIQVLASRRGGKLLDMHFMFYDPASPEDIGAQVEDEEVRAAYESGYFVNPVSGREIEDFERYLLPYFEPSSDLELQ